MRVATVIAAVLLLNGISIPSIEAQVPDVEVCSVPIAPINVDQPSVEDEITVFDSITIADLQVSVDITHTFVGDLAIAITHDGTTVGLHAGGGGAGNDLLATFNDAGAPYDSEPFNCDCAMAPSGPGTLSDFDGDSSAGDWTLNVDDSFPASDDGVLTTWCVRAFENEPAAPPPPLLNLVCSSTPGSGTATLFWTGTMSYDEYQVYINGELATVVPGFLSGTNTGPQQIPSTIEVCVRGVIDGVASPPRCCSVAIEQVIDLEACVSPGQLINELFPVLSVISVGDDITVGDLQVQVDVSHTFLGDLDIDLSSPDRTTVRLHDQGGTDADDIRLTYWEFGVPAGSLPYDCECAMQPSGPGALTDFVGVSSQGLWRLFVVDNFLEDFGLLNSWCLRVYENMPVFAVTELACEVGVTPGTAVVTWTNPTDYDEVDILVNGTLDATLTGPFSGGALESYTTNALSSAADIEICVIPRTAGIDGPPQCCEVSVALVPPVDIVVDPSGGTGTAFLTWTNPLDYDTINVYVDNVLVDQLSGTSTTYVTDPASPIPATFSLCLEGVLNSFGSSPLACRNVVVLPSPSIEGCSSPEVAISDVSGPTVDSIFVATDEIILDLEVAVSISHTFLGDLDVDLTSPLGTTVRLHDQGGGASDDLFAVFNDKGAPNGSVPFDCGCGLQPSGVGSIGSLADFLFEPTGGEWTLSVTDNLELDNGTLHYWCLRATESCDLQAVSAVTCEVSNSEVVLTWTNEDMYTSLEIMRDDVVIDSLPGDATTYLDTTVAPGAHEYRVVAVDSAKDCESPSQPCSIAFGITDLVVSGELPFGIVDSTTALVASLQADGRVVQIVSELTPTNAAPPESEIEAFWIVLGSFPANRPLTADEGLLLAELHTGDFGLDGVLEQTPVPVYFESGDTWGFDAPTAFNDYDGIANDFIDDGDDSLFNLFGQNTGLGLDLSAGFDDFYQQDQPGIDYNDQLIPANSIPDAGGAAASLAWLGGDGAPDYGVGVYYLSSVAPVISQSFEGGGYLGDLDALVALYRSALLGELMPPVGVNFKRGDFDGDGQILINDPIGTLSYIFADGPNTPCPDAGDANDDGAVGISDPIFTLGWLFSDGPAPAPPGPFNCGPDLTEDPLGPCTYDSCE